MLLRPLQPSARVSVYHRLKMAIEGNVRWPTQPTYDAAYLRSKARKCRELARMATMPEVRRQLRLFAEEF